jgi:hypothetical protein
MGRRAQGMDITPWGDRSLGTLRYSCKGALETGNLSLWELCSGNLKVVGGPEGYERKALGMYISLYRGSVGQPGL